MSDPLDDLYGAPLGEFTRARNDLVKALKSAGKKEEAAEVGKLKRPTVPAWALNQLTRRDPDAVEGLIDIQTSLGEAKDAQALKRLGSERRRTVTELTEAARKLLVESGQNASTSTLEKISSTLLAVTNEEEQEVLRRGRFQRELSASGFTEAFGGLTAPEAQDEPEDPAREREARERAERLSREAEQAEREARRSREKVEALEGELAKARRVAESQEGAAEAARREAEGALAQLDNLD